ncbi:MAG TPA: NUDIX hydrolase [Beijerinckiaceae bacterium]
MTPPFEAQALPDLLNERVWSQVSKLAPTRARPSLAATLILIDRAGPEPRLLMGRRNPADRFMPGKFVFPGGRVDPSDRRMAVAGALPGPVEARLARIAPSSPSLPRALALAAIRETYEETGLLVGTREYGAPENAPEGWRDYAAHGVYPELETLHFIARAITPPRLPRRYDTVFFAADVAAVCGQAPGFVGPDRELVETVWAPLSEALELDLPVITGVVLRELERRLEAGLPHFMPTPCYRVGRRGWIREEM